MIKMLLLHTVVEVYFKLFSVTLTSSMEKLIITVSLYHIHKCQRSQLPWWIEGVYFKDTGSIF